LTNDSRPPEAYNRCMKKSMFVSPVLALILVGAAVIIQGRIRAERLAERAAMIRKDYIDAAVLDRASDVREGILSHFDAHQVADEISTGRTMRAAQDKFDKDVAAWRENKRTGGPASEPGPPPPFAEN
jgi:hypothetical protein